MSNHNKVDTQQPYHQFLNIIAGSLSPVLKMPEIKRKKQHQNYLNTLIKVIAVGIIIAEAPWLSGVLLEMAGITVGIGGSAIATGVTAALSDAAFQGVAVKLGIQDHFSLTESLEVGMTAGVGSYLGGGNIKAFEDVLPQKLAEVASQATKVATINVATQLAEMGAGLRDKFDPNAVAFQVAAAITGSAIESVVNATNVTGPAAKAVKTIAKTTTNTILGKGITHTPIDIQNVAANMIGSTVVDEVSDRQNKATKVEKRKEIAANATIANDDGIDPFTPLPDPTLDGELRNLRHTDSTTYALSEMNARQMRLKALESANIRAQIKNRPPTATEELILKADAQSVGETYSFSNAATPLEKVAAFGATIPLIPESIAGALGAVATRTLIGPVSEALVLDTLGGQVLTQTIGRAGVAMGGSKFLNKWGLFGGEGVALRQRVLENIVISKAGSTEKNIQNFVNFSRRVTAREFYAKGGWPAEKINDHLAGIDFSRSVTLDVIPKGEIMMQEQLPGFPMGNYFTKPGANTSQLGIYTSGRIQNRYVSTCDIPTLKSTAADITDTWSMRNYGWKIELKGGEDQYFTHNLSGWRKE